MYFQGQLQWLSKDINVRICRSEKDKRRYWRNDDEDIVNFNYLGLRIA